MLPWTVSFGEEEVKGRLGWGLFAVATSDRCTPLPCHTYSSSDPLSRGAGVLRRFVVLGAGWGERERPSTHHQLLESTWGMGWSKEPLSPGHWQELRERKRRRLTWNHWTAFSNSENGWGGKRVGVWDSIKGKGVSGPMPRPRASKEGPSTHWRPLLAARLAAPPFWGTAG